VSQRFPRTAVVVLCLALAAGSLAACDPGSPVAPSSATPTPGPLLAEPGLAAAVMADLVRAAGTAHAVRAEVTPDSATLTTVTGQATATFAWRDGQINPAEPAADYVGQALFDPREFDLGDVGALFEQAAAACGSATGQRLNIAEYADGRVFMSVTTAPESAPVFFRPDGSLVAALDFSTAGGLAEGLADVVAGRDEVLAIGLDAASGGLYAEAPGPAGEVVRTVRLPGLPVRDTWAGASDLVGFDPAKVDPRAIAEVLARLPELTGQATVAQVSWTIDRRGQAAVPSLHVTADGHAIEATLAGAVVPG
jgi:hypothetical protein